MPLAGVRQRTRESTPPAVWVQGTPKTGKACLPYVFQQSTLCTSARFCQQPQDSLGRLCSNTLCIAYCVQMCGVMCLDQANSNELIASEMPLEPKWVTPDQMLLLLFLAPQQLVIRMPTMWQLTWETLQVSVLSVCLCLCLIYLLSSTGERSYLHLWVKSCGILTWATEFSFRSLTDRTSGTETTTLAMRRS